MSGGAFGEPWAQGTTLITPATRKWTARERAENDLIENRLVFSDFTISDNGRGRVLRARCDEPRDAERIVACVNACAGLADPSVVPELVAWARSVELYLGAVPHPVAGIHRAKARHLLARLRGTEPPQRHRANPDPAEAPHPEDRP